jgi:hypothetical protein
MQFQAHKKETIIINPAKNNERKSISSEIRKGPDMPFHETGLGPARF